MAKELGLFRRSNVWTYRERIPADLVHAFNGATELKRSLRTEKYREAKVRRNRVAVELESLFAQKRREFNTATDARPKRVASYHLDEIESLIQQYVYKISAVEIAELRKIDWTGYENERDDALFEFNSNILNFQNPNNDITRQEIYALEQEIFGGTDIYQDKSDADRVYIAELLRRALLEIERQKFHWLSHRYKHKSFDLAFVGPREQPITLNRVAEEYLSEHAKTKPNVGTKRKQMLKAAVQILLDFFGPEINVTKIDQRHCREFRDLLNRLPSNMRKHFPNRSVPLAIIASEASARALPRMKHNTQDKYVHALREIIDWAKSERYITVNPAENIKALGDKTPAKRARDPFENSDLNKIFSTTPYDGANEKRTGQFWVAMPAPR